MNNRIQEIKERIEQATDGPWDYFEADDGRLIIYDNTYFNRHIAEIVRDGVESRDREKANAELIARALEDNAYLLSEIERLQATLKWYADKDNYDPEHLSTFGYIPIDKDEGKRARESLSNLKG
ncbi:hypothetical protein D3C74_241560 [compost metagenome]